VSIIAVIDEMRASDVDEVAALEAAAFPARIAPGAPTHAERLREELVRPWTKLWIARASDKSVLGFLLAWQVVDELHILNVATHVAHRRQGVARALMTRATSFASEKRARQILLEVRRSNMPAIRLYKALGFFAMGVRRNYYTDGEDAVEMVLALDPETGDILLRPDEVRIDDV
jgi:ribosomal-protein-alanine N-acetyltransferase